MPRPSATRSPHVLIRRSGRKAEAGECRGQWRRRRVHVDRAGRRLETDDLQPGSCWSPRAYCGPLGPAGQADSDHHGLQSAIEGELGWARADFAELLKICVAALSGARIPTWLPAHWCKDLLSQLPRLSLSVGEGSNADLWSPPPQAGDFSYAAQVCDGLGGGVAAGVLRTQPAPTTTSC